MYLYMIFAICLIKYQLIIVFLKLMRATEHTYPIGESQNSLIGVKPFSVFFSALEV